MILLATLSWPSLWAQLLVGLYNRLYKPTVHPDELSQLLFPTILSVRNSEAHPQTQYYQQLWLLSDWRTFFSYSRLQDLGNQDILISKSPQRLYDSEQLKITRTNALLKENKKMVSSPKTRMLGTRKSKSWSDFQIQLSFESYSSMRTLG